MLSNPLAMFGLGVEAFTPSQAMFAFCTKRFHISEAIAAKRIRAGRTADAFPCIFRMIARGELHLSGVHEAHTLPRGFRINVRAPSRPSLAHVSESDPSNGVDRGSYG